MKQIFLGPAIHWLILAILAGLTWFAGSKRLHVSEFNFYVTTLILISIVVVVIVLRTSPPDRQVTRDPLEDTPPE